MSVEDRLRSGLEANATAFVPAGERRLAEVHRRRRRRAAAVATATATVVIAGAAAVGWWLGGAPGGGGAERRGIEPVATPSTGAVDSSRIPESAWIRRITRDQAVRAGADDAWLEENFGDAARIPLVLSFFDEAYSESARYAGGWSVGDAGTVSYDEDTVVLTSTSPGCRGCRAVLRWRITGDRLLLDGGPGDGLDPIEHLMIAGTWTRQHS